MSKFFVFIFIVGILSRGALAGCNQPDVRLDRNPTKNDPSPGIMGKIPVLDQGNLGTCYSHVASYMIEYERIKNGQASDGKISSPLLLAAQAKDQFLYNIFDDQIEGGFSCGPIKRGKILCRETPLESTHRLFYSVKKGEVYNKMDGGAAFIERLEEYYDNLMREINTQARYRSPKKRRKINRQKAELIRSNHAQLICQDITKAFPEIPFNLEYIQEAANATSNTEFIKNMLQSICTDKAPMPTDIKCKSNINMIGNRDTDSYLKKINENLNRGKDATPTSIAYCGNIYFEKDLKGTLDLGITSVPMNCGAHASLVIGRESVGDKCYYLVRNTWGVGCANRHQKGILCDAGSGNYLVEESLLKNNLFGIEYIE